MTLVTFGKYTKIIVTIPPRRTGIFLERQYKVFLSEHDIIVLISSAIVGLDLDDGPGFRAREIHKFSLLLFEKGVALFNGLKEHDLVRAGFLEMDPATKKFCVHCIKNLNKSRCIRTLS